MEWEGSEFLISHTFQRKRYISIARTGNFIMYGLGPFSRKRFQIIIQRYKNGLRLNTCSCHFHTVNTIEPTSYRANSTRKCFALIPC